MNINEQFGSMSSGEMLSNAIALLSLQCAGLPVVIWLIIGIVISIVALRVGNLRIFFKGRDRELTIETNNPKQRKHEQQESGDAGSNILERSTKIPEQEKRY